MCPCQLLIRPETVHRSFVRIRHLAAVEFDIISERLRRLMLPRVLHAATRMAELHASFAGQAGEARLEALPRVMRMALQCSSAA